MGVHQGAQCDRASLAQNYYYGGLDFFYPEVNETRCSDGIVSVEFPMSSYLAAVLYRLFGYDEMWFRLLTLFFAGSGLFGLFLIFTWYMGWLLSAALVLLVQFSPIFIFYSANFLPDVSSLGLALVAWYLFVSAFYPHDYLPQNHSKFRMFLLSVTLGLAIATKTTSLIQWMTMASMLLLSNLKFSGVVMLERRKAWKVLLSALILPLIWFVWSKYLGATHNSQYFMMRVPFLGWDSYQTAWLVYKANWPQETFSRPLIYLATGVLLLPFFLYRYIPRVLAWTSMINTLGSVAFLLLMMEQFKYHDYYIICLLPAFVFSWLATGMAIKAIKPKFWYLKLIAFFLCLYALSFQYNGGKVNLGQRYEEGNYWEQSHARSVDYDSLRVVLDSLGIGRNACVAVGYDEAPNNLLYLMHLRGYRYNKDHGNDRLNHVIFEVRPDYLISNDPLFTQQVRAKVLRLDSLGGHKYISVYRILHRPFDPKTDGQ